jgi:glycosyltransferase involved in cell wall biosynthesis
MQKIVLITPFPNPQDVHAKNTGVGSYSFLLVQELRKQMEVEVWAQKGESLQDFTESNLSVKRVWNKGVAGIFAIIKKLWVARPDIIHVQQELNIFGGTLAVVLSPTLFIIARILGVEVVTTMHGGFGLQNVDAVFVKENGYTLPPFVIKIAMFLIFGLIAHASNKIIVHEEWQKDELHKDYFVNKKKIFVIPHGVPDSVEIVPRAKEKLGIDNDKKVFLYMGFAARYKGLPELLDCYKNFISSDENKNSLLIVGAGPAPRLEEDKAYMDWYNNLKTEYEKLGDFVRWVGFIPSDQIATYYSGADSVLFPYSRRLAASGPMAIAIGYEKDIVLSSILKGVSIFHFNLNDVQKTKEMKKERTWATVTKETSRIYSN